MSKKNYAFGKNNLILIAIGMAVVIIGFLLMTGPSTTIDHFEADIFSARRIKVAPVMCLIGFVIMIYAVIKKPKEE
ncbi:MAG: DUF3098 domain-containing protein [Bacteroidaceae bacterium]|jgi:uncharacterized BrkB/YihY/UPF0761 family membrane protein|nr:DUF3098 domain-containing protein [Bacteroidaceae bacterium]